MCLLTATTTVYGYSTPKSGTDFNKVIQGFIESHLYTDYQKLDTVLNDNAFYSIPRQEEVILQDKPHLVCQMKENRGALQNCESKYEVLSKSDAMVIARIDFTYPGFTQHNYVIVEKNRDKEWKITQVVKMAEDDAEPQPGTRVIANN